MSGQTSDYKTMLLSGRLSDDIALFKEIFKKDSVLRVKKLRTKSAQNDDCALIYMDGMIDFQSA